MVGEKILGGHFSGSISPLPQGFESMHRALEVQSQFGIKDWLSGSTVPLMISGHVILPDSSGMPCLNVSTWQHNTKTLACQPVTLSQSVGENMIVDQAGAQQGVPKGKANQGHMVSSFPFSHPKTFQASRKGLEVDFFN